MIRRFRGPSVTDATRCRQGDSIVLRGCDERCRPERTTSMPSTSEGPEAPSIPAPQRSERPRVLCVDDDPTARALLARHLDGRYEVLTAAHGQDGMRTLADDGSIEVIVADMQMPGMDGATFLQKARHEAPAAVRILITGQLDFSAAISSLNDAQIFRFLAKPCSRSALVTAVDAAVNQYRLAAAERVLL